MARKKVARRYTTNEIGRRVRSRRASSSARGRKNAGAVSRTRARGVGARVPEPDVDPTRVGRDMRATKPPSPTGLVRPPAWGSEARRLHKPR